MAHVETNSQPKSGWPWWRHNQCVKHVEMVWDMTCRTPRKADPANSRIRITMDPGDTNSEPYWIPQCHCDFEFHNTGIKSKSKIYNFWRRSKDRYLRAKDGSRQWCKERKGRFYPWYKTFSIVLLQVIKFLCSQPPANDVLIDGPARQALILAERFNLQIGYPGHAIPSFHLYRYWRVISPPPQYYTLTICLLTTEPMPTTIFRVERFLTWPIWGRCLILEWQAKRICSRIVISSGAVTFPT